MTTIRLLVADNKDNLNNIKRMLSNIDDVHIVGEAENGETALEAIRELQPHIVIANLDLEGINGIKLTETILSEFPHIQFIIISIKSSPESFRDAMKSGAKDYLIQPFSSEDLADAIHNVFNKWLKDKDDLFVENTNAKIIGLFSTKGGVGKTTLAVNIAVALASRGKKTLLIDSSLQFGDVAVTLDLHPKSTIYDIVEKNEFSVDYIEKRMTKHSDSGLNVLVAPKEPVQAENITGKYLQQIIELVKPLYQFVIIDMPVTITDKELAILDKVGLLFLVSTPEITSLKNTKILLKTLQDISYDISKVKIILNKVLPDVGSYKTHLEASLGVPVYASIPKDSTVVQKSLTNGESFVLKTPSSQISKAVLDLAEKLSPSHKTKKDNMNILEQIKSLIFGN